MVTGTVPDPKLMSAWRLSQPQLLADTATSQVWRVLQSGRAVVLKALKPNGAEEAAGMVLLQWYQGRGAARVLARTDGAILMEWIDGPSLGDLVRGGDDPLAMGILVEVFARLHLDRPEPPKGLQPLAVRFAPLFDTNPSAQAAALAQRLLETTEKVVALHGDLHHDNILHSARGWLAIDPKGVWGDPAYEPSNAFRNPEGCDDLILQPRRINAMADLISNRMGLPRSRVLGWAAAHTALSICWHREVGNSVALDEALLPRLLAAHAASREDG
jgi:streptomycin 6-kinase